MKAHNLATILICLVFLAGITACKKERDTMKNCDGVSSKYSDYRLLNYLFATGSYWIYQEQNTLATDSQRVINGIKGSYPVFQYCQYMVDGWHSDIVSYNSNGTDSFRYGAGAGAYKSIYATSYSWQDSIHRKSDLLTLDLQPAQVDTSGLRYINKLPTLTVGGTAYTDILVFHLPLKPVAPNGFKYECDLYFAPYFGLVRKVEYNTPIGTQTWDLIRYNLSPLQ